MYHASSTSLGRRLCGQSVRKNFQLECPCCHERTGLNRARRQHVSTQRHRAGYVTNQANVQQDVTGNIERDILSRDSPPIIRRITSRPDAPASVLGTKEARSAAIVLRTREARSGTRRINLVHSTPKECGLVACLEGSASMTEDTATLAESIEAMDARQAIDAIIQHYPVDDDSKHVPAPILTRFLRRPHIEPVPLQVFVNDLRSRSQAGSPIQSHLEVVFTKSTRHALKASPESLEDITDVLLDQIDNQEMFQRSENKNEFLNRALFLLSDRASIRPFKSAIYQQNAMVKILEYMSSHDPPLQVSREGYRAITRAQLRLPKTLEERRWELLKALSWPPFKQDRTAMDTELTREDGLSRAAMTLERMTEAGYGLGQTDHIARMHAGWDTDGTPTIQSRHNLVHAPKSNGSAAIWRARIETTRTIQEAWACWESYKVQRPGLSDDSVALAVARKLRLNDQGALLPPGTVAGTGKELLPLPPSIHLHTYTATQPPSLRDFFTVLIQEENMRRMSIPLVVFFLVSTAHPDSLTRYLTHFRTQYPKLWIAFTSHEASNVSNLPVWMLDVAVSVLCNFARRTKIEGIMHSTHDSGLEQVAFTRRYWLNKRHCLLRAVWTAQQSQQQTSDLWLPILRAFARPTQLVALTSLSMVLRPYLGLMASPGELSGQRAVAYAMLAVQSYFLANGVLDIMVKRVAIETPTFHQICQITQRCIGHCLDALTVCANPPDTDVAAMLDATKMEAEIDLMLQTQPEVRLMHYFDLMAGSKDGDQAERSGTAVIEWSTLHSWIRALGCLGAHEGTLHLVRRICKTRTITLHDDQALAGQRARRKSVVALRLYLERRWLRSAPGTQTKESLRQFFTPASAAIVDEVRELIEAAFPDEDWPSDEEVEHYLNESKSIHGR